MDLALELCCSIIIIIFFFWVIVVLLFIHSLLLMATLLSVLESTTQLDIIELLLKGCDKVETYLKQVNTSKTIAIS